MGSIERGKESQLFSRFHFLLQNVKKIDHKKEKAGNYRERTEHLPKKNQLPTKKKNVGGGRRREICLMVYKYCNGGSVGSRVPREGIMCHRFSARP